MTTTATPTQQAPIDERSASAPTNEATTPKGHVGRIVIGSVVGGLIAAVLLVTVVRSREHVNTSSPAPSCSPSPPHGRRSRCCPSAGPTSRSDGRESPRRSWPLAGVAILVLAPTGNQAGWVWPPVGLSRWRCG